MLCPHQHLQGIMGLTGIGRPDMQDKMPLHLPCLRILHGWLRCYHLSDLTLHQSLPVALVLVWKSRSLCQK